MGGRNPNRERKVDLAERMETVDRRCLPDFVIIGTQRGGTTSLYRYLTSNPDIGSALRKEVHYFDHNFDQGDDWYRAHFPLAGRYRIVGEASPYYLYHPEVPERLQRLLPGAHLIALLRNPIDRALSHYQMMVRRGRETLSFAQAIEREPERLAADPDPSGFAQRNHSYLSRGLYADQLERWLRVVPRDRLHVVKSEDFYARPAETVGDLVARFGLPRWEPDVSHAYHLAEYPDMDPAIRGRLGDHFAPHNQRLYALLGRDLGWQHE